MQLKLLIDKPIYIFEYISILLPRFISKARTYPSEAPWSSYRLLYLQVHAWLVLSNLPEANNMF
jgi:hypothetical protein